MELVDITLETNYFQFENTFYLQIKGVAMGSSFAPSVANLFIAALEEDILCHEEKNPYYRNVMFWEHFIGDIFILFMDEHKLTDFFEQLNGIQSYDQNAIPFLGTIVHKIAENKLRVQGKAMTHIYVNGLSKCKQDYHPHKVNYGSHVSSYFKKMVAFYNVYITR